MRTVDARTEMMVCANEGNLKRALELLASGDIDVNETDDSGYTALHWCFCWEGAVEVARALLEAGADVNARSLTGITPLMRAAAVIERAEESVNLLLDAGADVNAQDEWGSTPLHYVLEGGLGQKLSAARALMRRGARAFSEDGSISPYDWVEFLLGKSGMPPAHYAELEELKAFFVGSLLH